MPSYTDLRTEPPPGGTAWLAQTTPANMTTYLLAPLRTKYGKGPAAIGAAGDNNHLYGRHRSRDWCLTSDYCPDNKRYYGTTDARDKRGAGNIYRAVDIGVAGPTQWDACRRLDAAVRAGRLPGVAEWFGTFDGENVVGWYEGHASSSDDSHLTHTHMGFWNGYADDEATMRAAYAVFTGEDDGMTPEQAQMLKDIHFLLFTLDSSERPEMSVAGKIETIRQAVLAPTEVEVELTPEQITVIAAAAQAGAEAGAPSHEELVAAAQEGAEKAEDQ